MPRPTISILGIFRLPVTDELVAEQCDVLYGRLKKKSRRYIAEQLCRKQLSSTVIVELLVENRDSTFRTSEFKQPVDDQPEENWQVAWAEAYLTSDGESLLVPRWDGPPDSEKLRVAFFIHYWNPQKPLLTSYGRISCPEPTEMPERLLRIVPYEITD